MDQLDLLSVAEAARRLNRSTEQVRRYLREKQLRGHRIGGQWFIEAKALTEFADRPTRERGFVARLSSQADRDPLAATIAIVSGGGSNIAQGKDEYRRSFRWRRDS
jgi:excisionase family DNA binding protein